MRQKRHRTFQAFDWKTGAVRRLFQRQSCGPAKSISIDLKRLEFQKTAAPTLAAAEGVFERPWRVIELE